MRISPSAALAESSTRWQGNMQVDWVHALRTYLAVIAGANLLWEIAHLPLYTIWQTGGAAEIAFAVLHCTGGDVLIASSVLVVALVVVGRPDWPGGRFAAVATLTVGLGIGYTIFSEWLNIVVRRNWAYADLMPIVPWIGTGLSPLLQWFVIPTVALMAARRRAPQLR